MSRLNIVDDLPAQICWKYIHNELTDSEKEKFLSIINCAFPTKIYYDIAYRIGYANSELSYIISETTYKKTKKWVRDMLLSEFIDTKITKPLRRSTEI